MSIESMFDSLGFFIYHKIVADFDLISVGDGLIDIFLAIHDAANYCSVDKDKKKICFDSGAKVLVDGAKFCLGGNACSVAVGLSRLDLKIALAAEIGDDEFSSKIITGLKKDKVSKDLLKITKDAPSTFSICLNFMQERTLFARHVARNHNISFDGVSAKAVYLTSLGKNWKSLYQEVLEFVKKTKAKLFFNPGSNQLKEGVESFKEVLGFTDIVFLNKEEAEQVSSIKYEISTNDPREQVILLLQAIQKMGPRIVVMTDGSKGSFALDEKGNYYSQDIIPCHFVEKTGAGDGFSTGFIAAIFNGKDIKTALLWGSVEAASVIEQIGAQDGLLTKTLLQEKIKKLT